METESREGEKKSGAGTRKRRAPDADTNADADADANGDAESDPEMSRPWGKKAATATPPPPPAKQEESLLDIFRKAVEAAVRHRATLPPGADAKTVAEAELGVAKAKLAVAEEEKASAERIEELRVEVLEAKRDVAETKLTEARLRGAGVPSGPEYEGFVAAFNLAQAEYSAAVSKRAKVSPGAAAPPLAFPDLASFDTWLINYPIPLDKLSMLDAARQQLLLGDFNNPNYLFPITRRDDDLEIDMISGGNLLTDGDDVRPAARLVIGVINATSPDFTHLLLGTSGSGKTSALADVARSQFVVSFTCVDPGQAKRRTREFDPGFEKMLLSFSAHTSMPADAEKDAFEAAYLAKVEDEIAAKASLKSMRVPKWIAARRVVAVELLCRLAQLYALAKAKPDLSPWEYHAHQKLAQDDWTKKLRDALDGLEFKTCDRLIEAMIRHLKLTILADAPGKPRCRIVIAVDEIETGAAKFRGEFDDKKDDNGFLSPLASTLAELVGKMGFVHIVFAGTGSSFHRVPTLESAIGKFSRLNVLHALAKEDVLPTVTPDACRRLFARLNVGDVLDVGRIAATGPLFDSARTLNKCLESDDALTLINRWVVGGRFRILTRIVRVLCDTVAEEAKRRGDASTKMEEEEDTKADRFLTAVRRAIEGVRDGIVDAFETRVGVPSRERQADRSLLLPYLRTVWSAATLSGGRARFLSEKAGVDLMRLGVGNYYEAPNGRDGYFTVTEAVVVGAIHVFLTKEAVAVSDNTFKQLVESFAALVEAHGAKTPGRGFAFEDLVFDALQQPRLQDVALAELPFVKNGKLPSKPPKDAPAGNTRSHAAAAADVSPPAQDVPMQVEGATPPPPPAWWTTTKFRATRVERHALLPAPTTASTSAEFLANAANLGVVYVPETSARPDAVVMLDAAHALTLGVTMWTSQVPNEKISSQTLSTAMCNVYKDAAARKVNDKSARTAWEAKSLDKVHAVRVHVSLPGWGPDDDVLGSARPEDANDLVVHLDQSNVHHLLGPDRHGLYKLLAVATDTDVKSWGGASVVT